MTSKGLFWKYFKKKDNFKAECVVCQKVLSYRTTTTNLNKHLFRQHIIMDIGEEDEQHLKDEESGITLDPAELEKMSKMFTKRADIWKYFVEISFNEVKCTLCKKTLRYKSNFNLLKHLYVQHKTSIFKDNVDNITVDNFENQFDLQDAQSDSETEETKHADTLLEPTHKVFLLAENSSNCDSNQLKRSNKKASFIWNYFKALGKRHALCKICGGKYSYATTTTNLYSHLKYKHPLHRKNILKARALSQKKHGTNYINCTNEIQDKIVDALKQRNSELEYVNYEYLQNEEAQECHSGSPNRENHVEDLQSNHNNIHNDDIFITDRISKPSTVNSVIEVCNETSQNMTGIIYVNNDCIKTTTEIEEHMMNFFITDMQSFQIVEGRGFKSLINAAFPEHIIPPSKYFCDTLLPTLFVNTKKELMDNLHTNEVNAICLTAQTISPDTEISYVMVTCYYIGKEYEVKNILLDCIPNNDFANEQLLASELLAVTEEWGLTDKITLIVSDDNLSIKNAAQNILNWRYFQCYMHTINAIVENAFNNDEVKLIILKIKLFLENQKKNPESIEVIKKYLGDNHNKLEAKVYTWVKTYNMLNLYMKLQENCSETALNTNDTIACREFIKLLEPFQEVLNEMSGDNYALGSTILPITIGLSHAIEDISVITEPSVELLRQNLISAIRKQLEDLKEFQLINTAKFLDPRYKLYFENEEEAELAKKNVIDTLASMLHQEQTEVIPPPAIDTNTDNAEQQIWKRYVKRMETIRPKKGTAKYRAMMEVEGYLDDSSVTMQDISPLQWWKQNKHMYPNLSKLAKASLGILATSSPCKKSSEALSNYSKKCKDFEIEHFRKVAFLNYNMQ